MEIKLIKYKGKIVGICKSGNELLAMINCWIDLSENFREILNIMDFSIEKIEDCPYDTDASKLIERLRDFSITINKLEFKNKEKFTENLKTLLDIYGNILSEKIKKDIKDIILIEEM